MKTLLACVGTGNMGGALMKAAAAAVAVFPTACPPK